MRRLARHLSTLGSVLTLTLKAALLVAWLASYANVTFISSRGVLYLVRVPPRPDVPNRLSVNVERWVDDDTMRLTIGQHLDPAMRMNFNPTERSEPTWRTAGVRFWDATGFTTASPSTRYTSHPVRAQVLAIAYSWLVAAAAIYPATLIARLGWRLARERRRRQQNLCPTCGYDLRASPGRCPECGTVAEVN